MESGLNNQTGLMLGVPITVGMIAEAEIFFPDLMPISLSPLFQNGVAMGEKNKMKIYMFFTDTKTSSHPAVKPNNHTDISHGISNQQPRK